MASIPVLDFWRCHLCFHDNNAELSETCLLCGHPRCDLCPLSDPDHYPSFADYNGLMKSSEGSEGQDNSTLASNDKGYSDYEQSGRESSYHNERNYEYTSEEASNYHYGYEGTQIGNDIEGQEQEVDPTLAPRYAPDYYAPDMTGFWVCHNCHQTNTPALNPDQCICGHFKNYHCCSAA